MFPLYMWRFFDVRLLWWLSIPSPVYYALVLCTNFAKIMLVGQQYTSGNTLGIFYDDIICWNFIKKKIPLIFRMHWCWYRSTIQFILLCMHSRLTFWWSHWQISWGCEFMNKVRWHFWCNAMIFPRKSWHPKYSRNVSQTFI